MKNVILFTLAFGFCLLPCLAIAQPEIKSATYTITEVELFNVQVVRISGRNLTVDIEGSGRRRFQVPRDFTFDIDGSKQTLNQLRPGQKLRAYVTSTTTGELMLVQDGDSTDGVIGEEVTDSSDDIVFADSAESPDDGAQQAGQPEESLPASLPKTATSTGWLAIAGGAFLLLALSLFLFRHRKAIRV